jgi:hypothetical protein
LGHLLPSRRRDRDDGLASLEKPANGKPGRVKKIRSDRLTPGHAHLYNQGDVHSPRRENETRLIRIEGIDITELKRDKFEIAA